MKRVVPVAVIAALLALSVAPAASAGGALKTKAVTYDQSATCDPAAAWVTGQGLPDAGVSGHALFLSKPCATAEQVAAFGLVDGAEGMTVGTLTNLSWEHRNDGHCGAGAPRWNLFARDSSGNLYGTVAMGCSGATHTAGSAAGWTKDSYNGAAIAAAVAAAGGSPSDKIVQLAVAFDEGTDQGPGFVYLDNITVNSTVMGKPGA